MNGSGVDEGPFLNILKCTAERVPAMKMEYDGVPAKWSHSVGLRKDDGDWGRLLAQTKPTREGTLNKGYFYSVKLNQMLYFLMPSFIYCI